MVSWDYNFEPAGSTLLSFTVKVLAFNFIGTQGQMTQTNYIDAQGQTNYINPYGT